MMMMMIETATAARFNAGANFCSSTALPYYRLEDANGIHLTSRPLIGSGSFAIPWSKFRRINGGCLLGKNSILKSRIRASLVPLSSSSDPSKPSDGRRKYHPSEEIGESTSGNDGDAMLTAQETSRTIVEVNCKATVILTGFNNDIQEKIVWPDLPYVTDEHGNIYFQVKNDEDILQTITLDNNLVQAIIGFDAVEMLNEMEEAGSAEIDFGFEELEDEDSDVEDDDSEDDEDEDYDDELIAVIDDENEDEDSDEALGDWAKLETVNSSHPMYFAKKLAQVASDDPIDFMEKPPAGLAVHGLIRPAFIEEHSDIQKHMSGYQSHHADINEVGKNVEGKMEDPIRINGHKQETESSEDVSIWTEESENDRIPQNGTSFYKLEMVKIHLISADGYSDRPPISETTVGDDDIFLTADFFRRPCHRCHFYMMESFSCVHAAFKFCITSYACFMTLVEIEDYRNAQPDAIAHSAGKIISRFKAGGEEITQALKSLCWRCKSIQVEEAALIGVDSLGFDLRVCSGAQIQTLRFAFNTRATSEYSAERQLNDLLFPRIPNKTAQQETGSTK